MTTLNACNGCGLDFYGDELTMDGYCEDCSVDMEQKTEEELWAEDGVYIDPDDEVVDEE